MCSLTDSDEGILLIANAEMLSMVKKTNYSPASASWFHSITFFFAETDRQTDFEPERGSERERERETDMHIYGHHAKQKHYCEESLSLLSKEQSRRILLPPSAAILRLKSVSHFSLSLSSLSHFTFSILEPSVLRSPHFAFQHRTTKSPQYIYILSSLKWSTSAHILVVEKNHFSFSSPFFVSSDLRPSLPLSYLNLKRIED